MAITIPNMYKLQEDDRILLDALLDEFNELRKSINKNVIHAKSIHLSGKVSLKLDDYRFNYDLETGSYEYVYKGTILESK